MTADHKPPISSVIRWLAISLVVCAVLLLVFGGLTTSRRAGMDDPKWPTEPWYLPVLFMTEQVDVAPRIGYFLEHSHRFAGWIAGGLAASLAFAAWLSGPNKKSRIPAVVAVFLLLGAYGWFHGQMMAADKLRQETGSFSWPWPSVIASATLAVVTVALAVWQLFRQDPAKWVRFLSTLVLLGVMIQGLLGGLRVFLNSWGGVKETIGVEFSQLHGIFAQVVFAAMVVLPILAGPRRVTKELADDDRHRLKRLSVGLVLVVFVQLVWAVWVRHSGDEKLLAIAQRLHILTAFLVASLIVWLAVRVLTLPGARKSLGFAAVHLLILLGAQLTLGVEAWMGKFAAVGSAAIGAHRQGVTDADREVHSREAALPPWERKVTDYAVIIRTGHQLIGAALLASAVVIAFRVLRTPAVAGELGLQGPRVQAAVTEVPASEPVSV